jgi:hypothetical protein
MSDPPSEIPAALTSEQWQDLDYRQSAQVLDEWSREKPERRDTDDPTQYVAQMGITYDECVTLMSRAHERVEVPPPARRALAALALHAQPFGFTHEDVSALRRVLEESGAPSSRTGERLRDLAARLAALLPPAEPQAWRPAG